MSVTYKDRILSFSKFGKLVATFDGEYTVFHSVVTLDEVYEIYKTCRLRMEL